MPLTAQEFTEMRTLWEDIKKTYETLDGEVKKYQQEGQESKNKLDAMETRMQEFDGKLAVLASPQPPVASGGEQKSQAMQPFLKACRYGYHTLNKEEKQLVPAANAVEAPAIAGLEIKGLTVAEDTTGGFFAPPEFVPEIIKGFMPYSPVMQYMRVRNTSARSVQMPKRTGTITAQWVGEKTERTELTGYSLGRIEIPVQEMYALVLISEQDLEDPVLDLESEIRAEISEQFGVAIGKALISGDGSKQPQGLLASDTGILADLSDSDGNYTTDTLMECAYNLPDPYVANARWLIKRTELLNIRKLRYTSGTNSYIWEPSIVGAEPAQLLGFPVVTMPDMPAASTGSYSMMLADFNRLYQVVQRVNITFKRLAERWVEDSMIGIYARMRIGGQVVLPEAGRIYSLT